MGISIKKIVATIKPFKLYTVKKVLTEVEIIGMVASEIRGYGRRKGHKEMYRRGAEYVLRVTQGIG